jgi:hypothetical protein
MPTIVFFTGIGKNGIVLLVVADVMGVGASPLVSVPLPYQLRKKQAI